MSKRRQLEILFKENKGAYDMLHEYQNNIGFQHDVLRVIAEHFDVPVDTINLKSRFSGSLEFDSLDLIELIIDFEEEFGIAIDDEEIDVSQFSKIEDIADFIWFKLKDH